MCWFVSKKKYDALMAQKEDFERIAMNAVTQNGRLLEQWDITIKEMKEIQEFNHRLVEQNEELLARVEELEEQRDMWRERAEEENRQAEIYREMLKSAEVG